MAESGANVLVGYLLNLVLVQVLLHYLGYNIQLTENAGMGACIALVSLIRSYTIRRMFSRLVNNIYQANGGPL